MCLPWDAVNLKPSERQVRALLLSSAQKFNSKSSLIFRRTETKWKMWIVISQSLVSVNTRTYARESISVRYVMICQNVLTSKLVKKDIQRNLKDLLQIKNASSKMNVLTTTRRLRIKKIRI